jgi:nucleoside-diphosphate-sugar epimerase
VITLLGGGYTGQVLARQLSSRDVRVRVTRRSESLRFSPVISSLRFDLSRPETWENLPSSSAFVWLFPAEPLKSVEEFLPRLLPLSTRIVVIGTTSSYKQREEHELLGEDAPLDMERERVRGEELLRSRGAIVLRSAGIYGPPVEGLPGRNPLDWLRSGRIPDASKFLNLIHVEDLAATICRALDSPLEGEQFIVSDGTPRRWSQIYVWAKERGYVGEVEFKGQGAKQSRRLTNRKLLSLLRPELERTDLYEELRQLEEARS